MGKKKLSDYRNVEDQINLYIDYLKELRSLCEEKSICYQEADRILYQFDIVKNGDFN